MGAIIPSKFLPKTLKAAINFSIFSTPSVFLEFSESILVIVLLDTHSPYILIKLTEAPSCLGNVLLVTFGIGDGRVMIF